jgi:hypothetical protein
MLSEVDGELDQRDRKGILAPFTLERAGRMYADPDIRLSPSPFLVINTDEAKDVPSHARSNS